MVLLTLHGAVACELGGELDETTEREPSQDALRLAAHSIHALDEHHLSRHARQGESGGGVNQSVRVSG